MLKHDSPSSDPSLNHYETPFKQRIIEHLFQMENALHYTLSFRHCVSAQESHEFDLKSIAISTFSDQIYEKMYQRV